jgi:hypothetical protein
MADTRPARGPGGHGAQGGEGTLGDRGGTAQDVRVITRITEFQKG